MLDPGIHAIALGWTNTDNKSMLGGWVYIVTNRPNGTLYVGVSSDLARLVWAELPEDIYSAIQREHNLKHWPRAWKV